MKSVPDLLESAILAVAQNWTRCSARGWADKVDEPDKVPLGRILPDLGLPATQTFELPAKDRARHLYILGATGSGKTNLILGLIAQDLAEQRSFALIDLRGDLVDRVLQRMVKDPDPELHHRVTLIDLRDAGHIVGFNPLAGRGEAHVGAYHVLDALKSQSASWGIQLEETLRNALIALAAAGQTLLELEPLLVDGGFRQTVMQHQTDPSVVAFFDRYDSLSEERRQAWFLPVLNKVTPLLGIPRLRLLFGAPNPIDLRRSLETPGSILLVSLAVDRLHSAAKLVGSFLIGSTEAAIMTRVDQPEADRNPVNLYIDEFETMASEAFQSIVAEGRRFRVALTLSHQNLSQLPPKLQEVIRNNVQTQVFFQTGSLDARKLQYELQTPDAADALQTLPIGHALVLKRPNEPILVQFTLNADLRPSSSTLRALTDRIWESMGALTPEQAEKAIAARTGRGVPSRTSGTQKFSAIEISHGQRPRKRGGSQ